MKSLPIVLGFVLFFQASADSADRVADLSIRSDYRLEDEILTTDRLGALDPVQKNPQLQNSLLYRMVQLAGVSAQKLETGRFRVSAEGLLVTSRGYLRGDGPRFQKLDAFPCVAQPKLEQGIYFGTHEGARNTLAAGHEDWLAVLGDEKIKLALLLGKIESATEAGARDLAEKVFQTWLKRVDRQWRRTSVEHLRSLEWKSYLQQAHAAKICPKKKTQVQPSKPEYLDPIQGEPPAVTQIQARIPARLWEGHFSIRVDFVVGDRSLNGRFLIDSGALHSVLSPVWLESQGIYPAWVSSPELMPARVRWSIPGQEGEGVLANWVHFDHVRVSGFKIPVQDFLLMDTDFFAPPEFVGSCCDGVLGVDFLRSFPLEFQADAPSELRIWPRENFHWGPDSTWKEFTETESGFSSKMPIPTKGKVTLDLPHGRIWFSKDFEDQKPQNKSGLNLVYKSIRGDRMLVVAQIKPGSPAASLIRQGMKVGTVITQLDSQDPSELDLWQVNRRLGGAYGDRVSLQWETRSGVLKMAPLILSEKKPN